VLTLQHATRKRAEDMRRFYRLPDEEAAAPQQARVRLQLAAAAHALRRAA
jgi:hypothetical protein